MKTKLLYFILSMFFLVEQSTFCAKITVINHTGSEITFGSKKIAAGAKPESHDILSPSDINFTANNNDYACKNIPIEEGKQYTVGPDYQVYTTPAITGMPFTCKQLPPKFTVVNRVNGINPQVWLGGNDFRFLTAQQPFETKKDNSGKYKNTFGIYAKNDTQEIKCDDIILTKNGTPYTIQESDGKIQIKPSSGRSTNCYFIGKVTVTNNTEGILSIGSTQVGGKNNKTVFEMNEDRTKFNAKITYNLKDYELKDIPALLGVTEYTIQEDDNNYVVKAGNNILPKPRVQKKK